VSAGINNTFPSKALTMTNFKHDPSVLEYAMRSVTELLAKFSIRPAVSERRSGAYFKSLQLTCNTEARTYERERAIGCLVDINLFLNTVEVCSLYEYPTTLGECIVLNNSLRGDFIAWILGAAAGDHIFIATKSGDVGMVRKVAQCCRETSCRHDPVEHYSSFICLVGKPMFADK
jgi:hypothetical protein